MNRRPGFRSSGRGVRRGRAKSGFFGWVALLVVVGLLGPMLVAVDVAPVWNVPTSSENSVGGTGSSGTAVEPAEVNFDVGVERTEEDAEVAAGGLVPAALAHAHTQPGGGCTYGRWSSGRCKACPSGQVWRTGRGCVSTTTTTNAPTTTTTVSRSCPAGQTYYSSYGGCRPSSCANGRTSTGYCRACADPTHLRSGGRCVPKTRPSSGDPSCPSGQLYYGSYGGCRPTNCSVGRTSSGYCRSCPSGQTYYSSYGGCRPSSCSNGRSSTGYCRACVDPTHQKVGGSCVPKTRPSPGDPSCLSGQLYYGSYGGCRPRSCPGGRTGSGYCRVVSPTTTQPTLPTGTTTTSTTSTTTTTTTTPTTTTITTTTVSTNKGEISTQSCDRDSSGSPGTITHNPINPSLSTDTTSLTSTTSGTTNATVFSTYNTITSSTITWEEALGLHTNSTTTSTTVPVLVPAQAQPESTSSPSPSSSDSSDACPSDSSELPATNVTTTIATFSVNRVASNNRTETITYSGIDCKNNQATGTAAFYINMNKSDDGQCPPLGIFYSSPSTGYLPVWGTHPNIEDDYGKVAVRHTGECSGPFSDDGPDTPDAWSQWGYDFWDFQIPCKAHDYCYDLMRAGFSGTVNDKDCDDEWKRLMSAECEDRSTAGFSLLDRLVFSATIISLAGVLPTAIGLLLVNTPQQVCNSFKEIIYRAVRLGSTWNTSLGEVKVYNKGSDKCLSHLMYQVNCYNYESEKFQFVPVPNKSGKFYIRLSGYSPARCIRTTISEVIQWSCDRTETTMFELRTVDNKAQHTIQVADKNWCLSIPETKASLSSVVLDTSCSKTDKWNIWWIIET